MYFSSTIVASTLLALTSAAPGTMLRSSEKAATFAGQATFYGGNLQGGTCSFSTYTLPSGIFGAALSDSNWDNAGNCGACIKVAEPGGKSITVMIVDQCPKCGTNHLDLFPNAFDVFASPSTGIIPTSFTYVQCPITSPLQLHNKEGVSQYWFSMQVVNANKAVASLDVSTDGGSTWQSTQRQFYNFFEQSSGFGTTVVDVKVTSVDGDVVVVKEVQVASGASTTATENFNDAQPPAKDGPKTTSFSTTAPVLTNVPVFTPHPDTTCTASVKPSSLPGGVLSSTIDPISSLRYSSTIDPTSSLWYTSPSTSTPTPLITSVLSEVTTAAPVSTSTTAVTETLPVVTVTVYSNDWC